MGAFDLRNVEPETLLKNMESRKYGTQLKKAWGDDENRFKLKTNSGEKR